MIQNSNTTLLQALNEKKRNLSIILNERVKGALVRG